MKAATLLACTANKSQPIHRTLSSKRIRPRKTKCQTSNLKPIKPPLPILQKPLLIKLHPLPPQQLQLRSLILPTRSFLPIAHETSHKTIGRDTAVAGLCKVSAGLIEVSKRFLANDHLADAWGLTTSGAKGFRLSAPPTARGEEFRAEAIAA